MGKSYKQSIPTDHKGETKKTSHGKSRKAKQKIQWRQFDEIQEYAKKKIDPYDI